MKIKIRQHDASMPNRKTAGPRRATGSASSAAITMPNRPAIAHAEPDGTDDP